MTNFIDFDDLRLVLTKNGNIIPIDQAESENQIADTQVNESVPNFIDRVADKVTAEKFNPKLEKLLWSNNWYDRAKCAKQGYRLDILVSDSDCEVRLAVAEQGYGLDKLINDPSEDVRTVVAQQGYRLDVLVFDRSDFVLVEIAFQGYGLDKLIDDESEFICNSVNEWLEKNNLTLEQWKQRYPDRCVL